MKPEPQRPTSSFLGSLLSPQLGLSAAALFWSGNFIVGRALRDVVSPLPLNFWRWMIALAILLPFTGASLWRHRQIILREWKLIAAIGVTGIGAFHSFVYLALVSTSAVNALLLLTTSPLLIALVSWIVFKDRITTLQWLGMGVSLLGAVTLIAQGSFSQLLALRFGAGDLWMLLAVLLWTAYSLLLKRRPAELPQPTLLCASIIAALAFMAPLVWLGFAGEKTVSLSLTVVWGLLYVSLFASVFAFLLWNSGVAKIGPSRASTFIYLMPVFGAALAFVFLDEGIQWFQWFGGALVFLGIAVMNRKRKLGSGENYHNPKI